MAELVRLNAGKTRFSLVPPQLLEAEAELYTRGAAKYQVDGWLNFPMSYRETLDSMHRHLHKFETGAENFDAETGAHHLTAARWNLGVLYMYERLGLTEGDDRFHVLAGAGRGTVGSFSAEQEAARESAAEAMAAFMAAKSST